MFFCLILKKTTFVSEGKGRQDYMLVELQKGKRMKPKNLMCLLMMLSIMSCRALATDVYVENYSFELPGDLKSSSWNKVPGWDSDTIAQDSGAESAWPGSTDGVWAGFIYNQDPSVYNLTDFPIPELSDVTYTLRVDAQDNTPTIGIPGILKMSLFYDDDGTRIEVASKEVEPSLYLDNEPNWSEYSLTFDVAEVPESVGHNIGIELENVTDISVNSWIGIDNVRLHVNLTEIVYPPNGAMHIPLDAVLKWTLREGLNCDVYFGTQGDPNVTQNEKVIENIYETTHDPYNEAYMRSAYELMSQGHENPRHARAVVPDGNYALQNSELGNLGGYSFGNGYGPYNLASGESFRIVMAEAANGLSIEKCVDIGKQYKNSEIDAVTKNEWVMTGKDSLFKSFRLAIDNFQSGYTIAQSPKPPKTFKIEGSAEQILLNWELYNDNDPDLAGFEIYRTAGEYANPFKKPQLIYDADRSERSYADQTAVRGVGYYYYILAYDNNGNISNRHYTQSYDFASSFDPAGSDMSKIRIVPNPYIVSSDINRLRFGRNQQDKLAFFNIPGQCTIKIFTESGELVNTIEHTDDSGDDSWNGVTSSNQVVASGIYIAVITNNDTGEKEIVKFVVIR